MYLVIWRVSAYFSDKSIPCGNLVCQTTFDQVKNLKFECPKCDFEFKQIGGLTKHMSLLHPEPVVKLTIQENEIVELPSCMFYKQ